MGVCPPKMGRRPPKRPLALPKMASWLRACLKVKIATGYSYQKYRIGPLNLISTKCASYKFVSPILFEITRLFNYMNDEIQSFEKIDHGFKMLLLSMKERDVKFPSYIF